MSPDETSSTGQPLAPWLQIQLRSLLTQRGHAWLLSGPSGLGQFDLALALASAWLCDQPTPEGACGIAAAATRSMSIPMPTSVC